LCDHVTDAGGVLLVVGVKFLVFVQLDHALVLGWSCSFHLDRTMGFCILVETTLPIFSLRGWILA